MMIRPNAKEISDAKADAMKRFGRPEVLEVVLTAPISAVVLVAPLDLDGWSRHVDAQTRDLMTSYQSLAIERRCWPDVDQALGLFARRPAAPKKVAQRLYVRAGQVPGNPQVELLADLDARQPSGGDAKALAVLAPALVEVIPGLSPAKARELLAAENASEAPRELWAIWGPGALSCVLASPDPDVWLAASTANSSARAKGERIIGSMLDFTRQALVWSRTPLDALLADKPAVATDLRTGYLMMGGEGAEATSKSL